MDLKYKIHILTSLNKKEMNTIERNNQKNKYKNENDRICQTINNLEQIIDNNIFHQLKSLDKTSIDRFQCLLNYIKQLLITFKYQYCNNQIYDVSKLTSTFCLNINKPQQQMVLKQSNDLINSSSDLSISNNKNLTTRIQCSSPLKLKHNKFILFNQDLLMKIKQSNLFLFYKNIFIIKNLYVYLPSIEINIMKTTLFDKDDYTQITKQNLNIIKASIGRLDEINNVNIKDKSENIMFNKSTQIKSISINYLEQLQLFRFYNINILLRSHDVIDYLKQKKEISTDSLNHKSKFHTSSFSSNCSPMDIYPLCGRQTYDRSSSAYTSKKRSHQINQSTPANILSRVAEKLDRNNIELKNSRDYLTTSNKSYSTEPNASDIYIKLSDCQAACRRWTAKHHQQNQSNLRSHYRHRTTKLPICYRNFPLSLNALSKYNNTRKRYIDRYHRKSTDHQQMKSKKNIQTKILVDIRKIPCTNMHSKKKVHDSFICFGTGSIDFIDGSNGPVLCLKEEEDSKSDEQICLYRQISKKKLDFEDGNEDEWIIDSSEPIEVDDESSLESISKQFSNPILVSAHIFREENHYDSHINLETSLVEESATATLYQNPSKATMVFDIIPACIVTLINYVTRTSILQLTCLPSVISESNSERLCRYQSPLTIRLIHNEIDVQHTQKIVRRSSNISEGFKNRENQSDQDSMGEKQVDTSSFKNQPILKKKLSITNSNDKQNGDLLLQNYELDRELIIDGDQNKSKRNLTINTKNSHGSNSSTIVTSDILIDQSCKIPFTNETTHEQNITSSSKSSSISLISEQACERQDELKPIEEILHNNELSYSNANSSTSTLSSMKEDQLLENDKEFSSEANQFVDNSQEPFDDASRLRSSETYSPISTASIETSQSIPKTTQYLPKDDEIAITISEKKSLTFDEQHINIPRCVRLCNSFKQMINYSSDADIPKHSSTEISTFPKHHYKLKQNSNDEQKSSCIDFSNRKTALENTNIQSACYSSEPSSIQFDNTTQQSDKEKKSIENLKISRIMTMPRKTIHSITSHNNLISVQKQKKYYVKTEYSNIQADQLSVDTSSRKLKKSIKSSPKPKSTSIPTKPTRQQKSIRPSWVSVNKTPTTNSHSFKKALNQTSASFQQLKDPCQILEVYTRFKRINCKPYTCTPLPPCHHLSPCFYIKNPRLC